MNLSLRDGGGHVSDEMVRRLRVPAFGLEPVGHHDHVDACRRLALPAIDQVEQAAAHDDDPIASHMGRT
jgi:hypothetical protein